MVLTTYQDVGRGLRETRLIAWQNGCTTLFKKKTNILLGLLTLDRSNHLVPRQRFKQRFRQRFTSASPTSIGRAMLEIAAQRFLVRFVRICWKLRCNGRQDQLPGVNFLHDAGTGEEEMIDAEHLHTSPPLRLARLP